MAIKGQAAIKREAFPLPTFAPGRFQLVRRLSSDVVAVNGPNDLAVMFPVVSARRCPAIDHLGCALVHACCFSSITGQRLMRHRDAQSTNRYYHEWAENLVDAVKKIDSVVKMRDNF